MAGRKTGKRVDAVIIEWEDIATQNGWCFSDSTDPEKIRPPCYCVCVGMLVHENESHIWVALNSFLEPDGRTPTHAELTIIPRGCIHSLRRLQKIDLEEIWCRRTKQQK